MANHQREGANSNADVGRKFEKKAKRALAKHGLDLESNFKLAVGLGRAKKDKKEHTFDFGSERPKVIVECKSHTWTAGGNVPSAKMKNWAEAMFHFHMAPKAYRKIFIVERSVRKSTGETLLCYFKRIRFYMIPSDVELWEL